MKLFAGDGFETKLPFGGVLPVMPVVETASIAACSRSTCARWRGRRICSRPACSRSPPDRDTLLDGQVARPRVDAGHAAGRRHQLGDKENKAFLLRARSRTSCRTGSTARRRSCSITTSRGRRSWACRRATTRTPRSTITTFTTATFCRRARPDRAPRSGVGQALGLVHRAARQGRRQPEPRTISASPSCATHGPVRGARLGQRPAPSTTTATTKSRRRKDMNFSTGMILWGDITGNKTLRDTGIFPVRETRFRGPSSSTGSTPTTPCSPRTSRSRASAWVWTDGAAKLTTRGSTRTPIMVQGINYLAPFTGGSLYLGRRPELVKAQYAALMKRTRNAISFYVARLRAHVPGAVRRTARASKDARRRSATSSPEFGNSRALTHTWVRALAWQYGNVDASVTAGRARPYAVFKKGTASAATSRLQPQRPTAPRP